MTHACVPEELMKKQGLTRSMIRLSVGLENVNDIIADLQQALEKEGKTAPFVQQQLPMH